MYMRRVFAHVCVCVCVCVCVTQGLFNIDKALKVVSLGRERIRRGRVRQATTQAKKNAAKKLA